MFHFSSLPVFNDVFLHVQSLDLFHVEISLARVCWATPTLKTITMTIIFEWSDKDILFQSKLFGAYLFHFELGSSTEVRVPKLCVRRGTWFGGWFLGGRVRGCLIVFILHTISPFRDQKATKQCRSSSRTLCVQHL